MGLTVWAYRPALDAGFVFDDLNNIVDSPALHWNEISLANARTVLTTVRLQRRPVANLSFGVDHAAAGMDPARFHRTNLLIHLAMGAALMWVSLLYARHAGRRGDAGAGPDPFPFMALLPAAVFLLHPLNTQAVTYVVQRMASLAALFVLLAFGSYLMARYGTGRRRWGWLVAAALFLALGMGSKENAALLLPAILVYEWCFFRAEWRGRIERRFGIAWDRRWTLRAWLGLAAALVLGLLFVMRTTNMVWITGTIPDRDFSGLERMLTQPRAQLLYLSLLLWPSPSRLNLDHDFAVSRGLLDPASTLFAAVGVALLLAGAVLLARRHPRYGFPLLAYAVFHAMEAGPFSLEMVFEHRMYLPMAMLVVLAAAWMRDLRPDRRLLAVSAVLVLSLPLAGWTHARNRVWADDLLLQEDIALKSPNKARAQHNYARALLEAGRLEEAYPVVQRAVELEAADPRPRMLQGRILQEIGRPDEAVLAYRTALGMDPGNLAATLGIGSALEAGGRQEEAYRHYLTSGLAFAQRGRPWEAIPVLQAAVAARPGDAQALNALGSAYLNAGLDDRAAVPLREAVVADPTLVQAWYNLGVVEEALGRRPEALAAYREFVDRAPLALQQAVARARLRIRDLENNR